MMPDFGLKVHSRVHGHTSPLMRLALAAGLLSRRGKTHRRGPSLNPSAKSD